MGIKTKITLAMLSLIFVTASAIATLSYLQSKYELTKAVETGNAALAETVSAQISTINGREFKMLETLAKIPDFQNPDVDLRDKWVIAHAVGQGNSKYFGLAVYDPTGEGYGSSGKAVNRSDREYIQLSMKGQNAIMDPTWSEPNKAICTFYAIPFYDTNGRQLGEVNSVVNAESLCTTVSHITVGKGSHPFVISRKSGKYVYRF